METMKKNHNQNELEEIIEEISKTVDLGGDYKDNRFFKMLLCYFLWKIQTDKSIKTTSDMETYGYGRSAVQFKSIRFVELLEYFDNNESKWEKLLGLVGKYSDEDLADCLLCSDFFEDDFYEIVPDSVSKLVEALLHIEDGEKVIQLNSQISSFVDECQTQYPNSSIAAYDQEYNALTYASIAADIKGQRNIVFMDEPDDNKYNKVFANTIIDPAKNVRDSEIEDYLSEAWNKFPCGISNTWSTCGWALASLEEGGKVVAVMNAGQLTVKQTEGIRKFLCEGGYIEGVIMLPDKMYSDTWVNPYLLIMNKNPNKHIKFYDASGTFINSRIKGKRINAFSEEIIKTIVNCYEEEKDTVSVELETIIANDYNLNPLRYTANKDSSVETIELGSVIREIKRGISITAAEMDAYISEEPSSIKCVIPSSINEGVVSSSLYYHREKKKQGKNEVSYGDILLSKTGNPFKIAITRDRYLVVGNLYILDIDSSKINSAYLRCFLNSEQGQNELRKYAVGPTTPVISITNIQKVRIPVYDEKKQKVLNKKCEEIVSDLEKCYKQISDNEQEVNSIFG